MIDEYDIRISLCPISVAMFSSAPWMTLVVTGSTRRFVPPARPLPFPPAGPAPRLVVGLPFMSTPRF